MPKKVDIDSWDNLVKVFSELPEVDIACRGQDQFYDKMIPRIDRCLVDLTDDITSCLRMERALAQRFREHAPIHLSEVETRYLKSRWLLLIVMQHYGVPTRLLDWTKSPWVAAFFAVSSGFGANGYVYVFYRNKLEEVINKNFISDLTDLVWGPHPRDMDFSNPEWDHAYKNNKLFIPDQVESFKKWVATYYCREAHFPRLIAQQGLFTFASKPQIDHWSKICSLLPNDECLQFKIAADVKPHILRRLNNLGLNGATLFPGLDGIGRSLDGFARAWHLSKRPSQW